jgi:hypothetical protein
MTYLALVVAQELDHRLVSSVGQMLECLCSGEATGVLERMITAVPEKELGLRNGLDHEQRCASAKAEAVDISFGLDEQGGDLNHIHPLLVVVAVKRREQRLLAFPSSGS